MALLWWRKDDPEPRALIVALFWSKYAPPEEGQMWPCSVTNFEAQARRFRDGEREQRLREVEFVRRNLSVLKEDLAALMRRAGIAGVAK